nr:MAG TPA: hypothetical protein [Caudoviricetes sp.]
MFCDRYRVQSTLVVSHFDYSQHFSISSLKGNFYTSL